MNTIVLSPQSPAPSAMANISHQIINLGANSKKKVAIKTFTSKQRRAYWDAPSAKPTTQIYPQREVHPLARYPEWQDQEYRHAYLSASIEQGLAWQIRANRQARKLTQQQLAEALGTQQSAISRLEDPEYGAHSIETLISIANIFDCALSVRFIPYSTLSRESEDLSPEALYADPYSEEISTLEKT